MDNFPYSDPMYYIRNEYRAENFNPTLTILVRVDVVELYNGKTQFVGYAVLNVFTEMKSTKQPTSSDTTDFCLNTGAFQIPIMQGFPKKEDGLSVESLLKYKRLPAATVLIRIEAAAKDETGGVLSLKSVSKAEWIQKGVVKKPPSYQSRVYDSQLALPSQYETNLVSK